MRGLDGQPALTLRVRREGDRLRAEADGPSAARLPWRLVLVGAAMAAAVAVVLQPAPGAASVEAAL